MKEGPLKDEVKKDLQKELEELTIISDYLSKTGQQDEQFSDIDYADEFVILNEEIRVPKIVMMENSAGVTSILNKYSKILERNSVEELANKTGMDEKDIVNLMEDGMQPQEIEDAAEKLLFRDMADSQAIREMIRQETAPEQLAIMKSKGISIIPLENGDLEITTLEKIAEVDEKGLMTLDEKWVERQNLGAFSKMGLINLDQELAVKQTETEGIGKARGKSLQVVSMDKRKEEKTKEEIEKAEIAQMIGETPDNIISIIRIEDRDAGSKLFNQSLEGEQLPMIVRLRNDNFKIMAADASGKPVKELQGFEATPASKVIASALKDTRSTSSFTSIKAGDIQAGKTKDTSRYDLFLIRGVGDGADNGGNQFLYLGYSGKTDVSVVQRTEHGDLHFDTPISRVYPKKIYLESDSQNKVINIGHQHDDTDNAQKNIHDDPTIKFADIEKRIELLEKLKQIEERIEQIESSTERNIDQSVEQAENENQENEIQADMSDGLAKEELKLPDLYSQRDEILMQLGKDSSQSVQEMEQEEEHVPWKGKH